MASESVVIESNWDEAIESFEDMSLREELLRGIFSYGFEKPSIIQQKGIRPIILGRDTIAQAQSGTGKTATFAISMLQLIDTSISHCQALILAPTRELAWSIHSVVRSLGEYMGVRSQACRGGTDLAEENLILERGVHAIVGTPGRVLDLLLKKRIKTRYFRLFIIEEVDRTFDLGFKDQIKEIFALLPENIQCAFFSASIPNEILQVAQEFMRDPARILVKREEFILKSTRQYYIAIEREDWKLDKLQALLQDLHIQQAIIYVNTIQSVEQLTSSMTKRDFVVCSMHEEIERGERDLIMKKFRSGSTQVLITTDFFTLGIGAHQASLVINFDMPINYENYLHHIGRSGLFGHKWVVINFVTDQERQVLKDLELHYNTEIEELPDEVGEIL